MSPLLRVFFWGLLISFLVTLPMGTLNVTAMQIGIQESIKNALLFALGSLTVEMIYVRISLVGINWVRKQERLMRWMQWITLAIIVVMATGSIIAALHPDEDAKNVVLENNIHRTLLRMGMCAINPVQIPFWFGWGTVLFSKRILQPVNSQYNIYIVGIGLGTLLGNALFIFGGRFLYRNVQEQRLAVGQVHLNKWLTIDGEKLPEIRSEIGQVVVSPSCLLVNDEEQVAVGNEIIDGDEAGLVLRAM